MKKLFKILSGLLVSLLIVGIVFAANPISVDRNALSFYFDGGNNNGVDTVWETSGNGLDASEVGTVTFDDDYVELPGTNGNYMTSSASGVFNTANICLLYVFTPDFEAADDNYAVLMDGDGGATRYGIHKGADANSNYLPVILGGTTVEIIPLATYEPYWKANEENVIIVSGTSGDTNAWLNGTQILTNDATAWTPQDPATIYVGASYTGGSAFDGKIHSYRAWQRQCTTDEVTRYSANRSTEITLAGESGVTLDLVMGNNDGAANVWDGSDNKLDATETGTVTFADDGITIPNTTGNYVSGTGTGVYNSANQSWVLKFTPNHAVNDNTNRVYLASTTGSIYGLEKTSDNDFNLYLGNTGFLAVTFASYEPYWNDNAENIFVYSGTTGNNNLWLNGTKVMSGNATAWTPANPANYFVGTSSAGTAPSHSKIHYYKVRNRLLSDAEVASISSDRSISITSGTSNNVVGLWNMDSNDVSGTTVFDKSFYANNATLVGAPSFVTGKKGEGVDLNGTSQYLTATDNAGFAFGTGDFTLAAWVNIDDLTKLQHHTIFCKGNPESAGEWCFQVLGNADSRVNFRSNATNEVISTSTLTQDEWVHVVITRTSGSLQAYINGVADGASGAFADNITNAENITMGYRNVTYNGYFDGTLDDVRIYNDDLTADEISNLYNAERVFFLK